MCCTRLAENSGCKNYAKNRPLGTIAQITRAISSQPRHASRIGKNLLNSNSSCTCPHNMLNFGPLTAEIRWQVWGAPSKFRPVSRLGFVIAQMSLSGGQQNFAGCLGVSWSGTLYAFLGTLAPLTEFCQLQNSLCVQVLRYPILAALVHGNRAAAVSQTLWRGTRNGITELLQRALITLGIGPNSSYF